VPLEATSPMEANVAPLIATGLPSTLTFLEYFLGELLVLPMLGRGVGTKGAGARNELANRGC